MATDFDGSSGSSITRSRFSFSGGSPGASAVITGSMFVGWKISLSPKATPVAIAPIAECLRHESKRLIRGSSWCGSWGGPFVSILP